MTHITRSMESAVLEVSQPKRTIVHIVGSDALDRHHTVVDPWGLEHEKFMSLGGVVPWEHGKDVTRGTMPIAECLDIGQGHHDGHRVLKAKTRFLDVDDFSLKLWRLYADRKLRGWSVGFLSDPAHESPPTREEIHHRPELRACKMVYGKGELTEYSASAIPSNTTAVTLEVMRSLYAPSSSGLTGAQIEAFIAESRAQIRTMYGQFIKQELPKLVREAEARRVFRY